MWRWFLIIAGALALVGCGSSNVGKVEKTTVPMTGPPPPLNPVNSTLPLGGEKAGSGPSKGPPNKGGPANSGQPKSSNPPKLGLTPPK